MPSYQPEAQKTVKRISLRTERGALEPLIFSWQRTMFLHDAQELDDDFGAGADENLAFPGFFGIVDGVERIVEHTGLDHD